MSQKDTNSLVAVDIGENQFTQEKLAPYLSFIEEAAHAFDLSVIVSVPSGPSRFRSNKHDVVYLYIDSYPKNPKSFTRKYPEIIYGHKTPEHFCLIEVEPELFKESKSATMYSPEGLKVGCICENNMWIYPGLLDSEIWQNGEDKDILRLILYTYLTEAVALGSDVKKYNINFIEGYKTLRESFRGRLCEEGNKKRVANGIVSYINIAYTLTLGIIAKDIQELAAESEKLSLEDYALMEKIIKLENIIENASYAVKKMNFEKEFDLILSFDKIRCVRVVNQTQDSDSDQGQGQNKEKIPVIVVFTDRIDKLPSSLSTERYNIGAWEIVINPSLLTRGAVRYYQKREFGEYIHGHANSSAVCFGNNYLNSVVDKFCSTFDIAALAHIAVSFLIKESTKPVKVENTKDRKLDPKYFGPDHYLNSNDKEVEKNKFVNLVKKRILQNLILESSNELKDRIIELAETRKSRASLRDLFKSHQITYRSMEAEFGNIDKLSLDQVSALINNENVFWIIANNNEILIYFYAPHDANDKYFRMTRGFVLKIQRGKHLQLENIYKNSLELTHASIPKYISEETESMIFKSRRRGRLSDLLAIAQNLISQGMVKG